MICISHGQVLISEDLPALTGRKCKRYVGRLLWSTLTVYLAKLFTNNHLGSGSGMFLRVFLEWINWVRKKSVLKTVRYQVSVGPQKRLFTSPFSHFFMWQCASLPAANLSPLICDSDFIDFLPWTIYQLFRRISSRTSVNYLNPKASAIVDQGFTGLSVCLVCRHTLLTYLSTILLFVQ